MGQIKLKRASESHLDLSPAPNGVTYEFWSVESNLQYFTQSGGLKTALCAAAPQNQQRPFGGCCFKARRTHCLRGRQQARIWQGIYCITANGLSRITDLDHDETFKGELLSAEESSGTWLSKQSHLHNHCQHANAWFFFFKHEGHINV